MTTVVRQLRIPVQCHCVSNRVNRRVERSLLSCRSLLRFRDRTRIIRSFTSNSSSSSESSEDQHQNVRSLLSNADLFVEGNFIGNRFISSSSSSRTISVQNPSTNATIGIIPSISKDQLEESISSSHQIQSRWSSRPAAERAKIIRQWFDLMLKHRKDLGIIMTIEQGKPLKEAIGEIEYAAGFLEIYSAEATRVFGETIPSSSTSRILVSYAPVGVVAAITPWNFPAAMITRKVGAALAAGCSVILKPSEYTPFSALALCKLALEAGMDEGVLQIVTGDAAIIGKTMATHPLIRKVTFTGSTRVGKLLIEQSASTVKRMSMELGGNAPFIIFADADLDAAVNGIIANKFRNCGQTCVTANRFFVHNEIYDSIVDKVKLKIAELKIGDGMSEGVTVGPLIYPAAVEKVEQHVRDALEKGGKLLIGGRRATPKDSSLIPRSHSNLYYLPTLITNANSKMRAYSEETFGPVAFFYRFSSDSEALIAANDTTAGLASYVYTKDYRRIVKMTEGLQYGMIGVNQGSVSVPAAPFGGMKESGFGREGSHHGLTDYLDMKALHIAV